ncbi:MAG: RdgB/HAM1 family non-canonical purine NTP pyrophosphatase [Leptospirales bacterium]|nr:RdgB/HAM1 family non-canonical purine NTP pyrophosphatase [Leptospirales bacterium]
MAGSPIRLALATNNPHKVRELSRLLDIALLSPADLGLRMDVEETGVTFEANAALKSRWLATAANVPAIADDSGIVVDALNGEPGVYSARYGGEGLDDRDRRLLILKNLKGIPDHERTARYVCVIAVSIPGQQDLLFRGECEGQIIHEERGTGGFGYDPIFLDLETKRTFAELSPAEKDARSHRGRALELFKSWMVKSGADLLRSARQV